MSELVNKLTEMTDLIVTRSSEVRKEACSEHELEWLTHYERELSFYSDLLTKLSEVIEVTTENM